MTNKERFLSICEQQIHREDDDVRLLCPLEQPVRDRLYVGGAFFLAHHLHGRHFDAESRLGHENGKLIIAGPLVKRQKENTFCSHRSTFDGAERQTVLDVLDDIGIDAEDGNDAQKHCR